MAKRTTSGRSESNQDQPPSRSQSQKSPSGRAGSRIRKNPIAGSRANYIVIAGNIGCGKSSLVEFLCRTYKLEPFYEPNASNPYLTDFYQDMKRWAFHSQLFFLSEKFRIHQKLEQQRRIKPVVQDRSIYEDAEIFAYYLHRRRFILKREWSVYHSLYQSIIDSLEPPDLLIYLRASVATIRKRIRKRARPEEQEIPVSYLRSLNKLYESWFESYTRSPTLVLDTDKLDYITDIEDLIDVRKAIEKHI